MKHKISKILIFSAARSDLNILSPIIKKLKKTFDLTLVQNETNSKTIIIKNNITIKFDYIIKNYFNSDTPEEVNKIINNTINKMSEILTKTEPDLILLVGDRYEMLAVNTAALPFNIPLAHLHGGEKSLGSFDNRIRNALTKLCHLHFCATKQAYKRIIEMGENPINVKWVGAPSLDNINANIFNFKKSIKKLKSKFDFLDTNDELILVTYHSVTNDFENEMNNIKDLFNALEKFQNKIIFTSPGFDPKNKVIHDNIISFTQNHQNAYYIENFGNEFYFDVLTIAKVMVGNSSSGIIEAASFNLPVVNVGIRQLGRDTSKNVLHCKLNEAAIVKSIENALSKKFQKKCLKVNNIYFNNGASSKIYNTLSSIENKFDLLID